MRMLRPLLPAAAALLAACSAITGMQQERQATFHVASYTRTCQGMYEMQCMLVREDTEGEWSNFYDEIEGFTYEPGYEYVLIVGWREIENPPADSSSRHYWLIRQVEKRRVGS